jgi:hypothetical protein
LGYKLREIEAESKFCRELTLEAIGQAVPVAAVQAVLAETEACEQRERKLNMLVTVLVTIAMNLYSRVSIGAVMRKIAQGLRYIWPDPEYRVPNDSAISQRRYQLGARPLVALFHRICQPLATPNTPGAFLFGMRLMAIDGSIENIADTPENVAAFGRFHGNRGDSAFPQVKAVYLAECGTHAIVDAGFWPCHASERVGGLRMLRSVGPGMLVMWDSGFHGFDMVKRVVDQGAQVLARLPAHVKPQLVRRLPDGSYLATIQPSEYARRKQGECLLVRLIEYTITDPNLPHTGEIHRLLTTLLDPERYPALDLACAYHERWEIELVIDETDTHQRLADRPLRSLKPVGVIQELYALLIAHYAIRSLMHEAAMQANLDPDRLSFTHALAVVQAAIPEFQMTAPDLLPKLYTRLLNDLAAKPLPERRLRTNPRVVKRKMSNSRLKRPEHFGWPQPSVRSFRQAVALI